MTKKEIVDILEDLLSEYYRQYAGEVPPLIIQKREKAIRKAQEAVNLLYELGIIMRRLTDEEVKNEKA